MHIHVFKTNVESDEAHELISNALNEHPHILQWNIDRDDKDNVLRVKANTTNADAIISTVNQAGFSCEELPD